MAHMPTQDHTHRLVSKAVPRAGETLDACTEMAADFVLAEPRNPPTAAAAISARCPRRAREQGDGGARKDGPVPSVNVVQVRPIG